MFKKILIANRGEIACRVIKTAQRLGVATVAVYSAADAGALHVRLADEAVCIGPAAAGESYLRADKILAACQQTGAQAVHPGYGFLSENAEFAAACAAAGVTFIGPPVAAIRAMGSKSEAKKLMEKAGVPLTPGYHGDAQDSDLLAQEAARVGYPALIKAAAGGGGKGMRVVERAEDFASALASCQREAQAAFGSQHVLIEKYLLRPRHIELQIFGDSHGNYVHLFERDCSVQRRHQKVLEEAPAPGMDEARRARMGEAALNAARAVGYVGAGTVEFIVNQDGTFYFMEMNTRLQVEHPVTEMITGVDLVEWQLRVAAGEKLPLTQEQIKRSGHALEARIYAEDPDKGFLPATGRLTHLAPPPQGVHVRVDSGVEQGDEISPHYDPMISKLIVWDETRERALARLLQALASYRVVGVGNNIGFLSRLAACPAFSQADLDTGLIEREKAFLFPAQVAQIPNEVWLLAALAELLREESATSDPAAQDHDPCSPWRARSGWRVNSTARRQLLFRNGEEEQGVAVTYGDGCFELMLAGQSASMTARGKLLPGGQLHADLGGRRINASVITAAERRHVFLHGSTFILAAVDPLFHVNSGGAGETGLSAPMPGKVVALIATPGAQVEKGAPLLILEAMKMEHSIAAPHAGVVKRFCFEVGDQVIDGALLVEFEAAAA